MDRGVEVALGGQVEVQVPRRALGEVRQVLAAREHHAREAVGALDRPVLRAQLCEARGIGPRDLEHLLGGDPRDLGKDRARHDSLGHHAAATALDQGPRVGSLLDVLAVDEALACPCPLRQVGADALGGLGRHVDADGVAGLEEQAQHQAAPQDLGLDRGQGAVPGVLARQQPIAIDAAARHVGRAQGRVHGVVDEDRVLGESLADRPRPGAAALVEQPHAAGVARDHGSLRGRHGDVDLARAGGELDLERAGDPDRHLGPADQVLDLPARLLVRHGAAAQVRQGDAGGALAEGPSSLDDRLVMIVGAIPGDPRQAAGRSHGASLGSTPGRGKRRPGQPGPGATLPPAPRPLHALPCPSTSSAHSRACS